MEKAQTSKNIVFFSLLLILVGGIFGSVAAEKNQIFSTESKNSVPTLAQIHIVGAKKFGENTGTYESRPELKNKQIGQSGEIKNGNLFIVKPGINRRGGFWILVDFINRKELNDKFENLRENIGIYITYTKNTNGEWQKKANWEKFKTGILRDDGPSKEFSIPKNSLNKLIRGISVVVENGIYDNLNQSLEENHPPVFNVEVDQFS